MSGIGTLPMQMLLRSGSLHINIGVMHMFRIMRV